MDNLVYVWFNYFQCGLNDVFWFDICYDGIFVEMINIIFVEGNYWGIDYVNLELGGGLYYYVLDKINFGGCSGFLEISLAFGIKVIGVFMSCLLGLFIGLYVLLFKDCSGLMVMLIEQFGGSFFDVFFVYQDRLEQEELMEIMYSLFVVVV